MRFYADENYPEQTVFALRELGHDVLTAKEDKRNNQSIQDENVLTRANELNRSVLTEDRDYIELHKKDQNHNGVVFTTEAKNKDFDAVALGVHKEVENKESLEGELVKVYKANTEKEKAEIEKLREEHKQELAKAKEEYQKNKEAEKEQKLKDKQEAKEQKLLEKARAEQEAKENAIQANKEKELVKYSIKVEPTAEKDAWKVTVNSVWSDGTENNKSFKAEGIDNADTVKDRTERLMQNPEYRDALLGAKTGDKFSSKLRDDSQDRDIVNRLAKIEREQQQALETQQQQTFQNQNKIKY